MCFFRIRKAINNIPILHSQPTVAGCHYEENPSFPIILIPIPTLSAVADRKIRNTHVNLFCAPAKNPVGAHASEIVHVYYTRWRSFFHVSRKHTVDGDVEVYALFVKAHRYVM